MFVFHVTLHHFSLCKRFYLSISLVVCVAYELSELHTWFFFFRFGNSKAKNKKKPSTLCVSLNSLAAPLHHCYYFEVVVYTHFFSFFSLTLLSLSSSQHTLLPRTYTNAFALQIFSMQLPYMLFVSVFFFVFTMTRRYYLMQQAW